MYAVVNINGHQYKVSPTQSLIVDRLQGRSGEFVQFSPLLVVDDQVVRVGSEAAGYDVTAKIIHQKKGVKVDVVRFRAKSRYHRHLGFRPQTTTLLIEAISTKKAEVTQKKSPAGKIRPRIMNKS